MTPVSAAREARAIGLAAVVAVVIAFATGMVPDLDLVGVRIALTFATYLSVYFAAHRTRPRRTAVAIPAPTAVETDVFTAFIEELHRAAR